jgi:acyl carrier protein phosphodiesterase
MNWLAHVFLSEQHIDFQMGNYLADPLKGKLWDEASENMKRGMEVHKIIDSFTDSHILYIKSKNTLASTGLLRSVVMDITYDYFLTKNWDNFSQIPHQKFSEIFYIEAKEQLKTLPELPAQKVHHFIQRDILNKYKSIDDLRMAFKRFDKRLSVRLMQRDTASKYLENVSKNSEELEKYFLDFFPQLCEEVKKNVDINKISHWKI